MTRKPVVSVVMSVFNGQRYLPSSLDSILSQGGVDLEMVIVDDGSTDGSSEILGDYSRRDGRVRVIRQENAGLTRALARACAEAEGTYIARQDDDDLAAPGRLARMMAVLEAQPDVAVASSWIESIGPGDEPLDVVRYAEGISAGTDGVLHERRSPVHGSVMFRRADFMAVGGYRPEFHFAQDSDLWFRLADRGGFLFVPEVLYRFRIRDGSISARHREAQTRLYDLAKGCRAARLAGESEIPLLREAALIRPGSTHGGEDRGAGTYFVGQMLLRNGDPRAFAYLASYVRLVPLDPRGWLGLARAFLARRRDVPAGPGTGALEKRR